MEINDQEMKKNNENYPIVIENDGQRVLGNFHISGKRLINPKALRMCAQNLQRLALP